MFDFLRPTPKLESYGSTQSRERLIQTGRILFVDDEVIPLVKDLVDAGFAVNHDQTGHDFEQLLVNQFFDVAIVDYSGVGMKYGPKQGLDLMRFMRRVSPRTRVIAYTSQGLGSDKSDFFRMADVVLEKDAGVRESLECIELQLRTAFDKAHLFESLLKSLSVSSTEDRTKAKKAIEKALKYKDEGWLKTRLKTSLGVVIDKTVDAIFSRLFVE